MSEGEDAGLDPVDSESPITATEIDAATGQDAVVAEEDLVTEPVEDDAVADEQTPEEAEAARKASIRANMACNGGAKAARKRGEEPAEPEVSEESEEVAE